MNTPDKMEELLERVREVDGPRQELDALIWAVSKGLTPRDSFYVGENYQFAHPDNADKSYYVPIKDVPALTSSLDACLDLMRECLPGWVEYNINAHERRHPSAWIEGVSGKRFFSSVECATEITALLDCILQALLHSSKKIEAAQ